MLKRKNTGLLLLCMILVFAMAGCNSFRAANTPNSCTSISGSSPKAEFEPGMSSESSNSASAPSGSRSNITPNSGTAASGTNTKAAEGKWVRKASMSVPRYDFGTETVNGKIYVIGGKNKSGELSSTEAYDMQSNQWKKMKSMPTPRCSLQTALLNGEIYAIGGSKTRDNGMGVSVETAEKYNPQSNTWITLKPMNIAREYHRLAVVNNKIYAVGGSADSSIQSTVEAYDPLSNTWADKAPMSVPRMQFGMELLGGKIYVIGGCSPDQTGGEAVATVEMYDPVKNQWFKKASMKTPRFSFSTQIIDGKIYAIGGLSIQAGVLSSVEAYDPVLDKWTTKKSMPTPRSWLQTAVVNGKLLAVGGWKNVGNYLSESFVSSVEEYNPKSDTWTKKEPILPARSLFQTEMIGSALYAFGGAVGSNSNTQFEPGTALVVEYTVSE